MFARNAQLVPARDVPEPDLVGAATRRQNSAVGRERDRIDRGMSVEGGDLAPARYIPELDRIVSAARGDHLAVRRDRDGGDFVDMSAENAQLVAASPIEELDRGILG